MKISDKELDSLFNSKLDGLEAEPSASLWQNISFELDKKSKKKSFVPALRIAASLIVMLSVGLLFLNKNDQTVKDRSQQKVVKHKVEQEQVEIKRKTNAIEKKDMLLLSAKNKAVKEAHTIKKPGKASISKSLTSLKPEPYYAATQAIAQNKPGRDQQIEISNTNIAQTKIAVVPDAAVSLKVQPEPETPLKTTIIKPQTLVANNGKTGKPNRKGIRNMGDLVNLVMAKVDKRPNKLIEFTNDDDGDESNVTGINLGIISIKKEK